MAGVSAAWPGVLAAESCSGTVSHGIAPGVFVLTTYPQVAAPAAFGDLVLSDGPNAIRLRGCKVDSVTGRAGPDGQTFTITILDRRWRWRFGGISGRYNQLDPRGKLVPWSIRSPKELALLCLQAMGETNFVIDLPDRLSAADGKDLQQFLKLGDNFPQSFTNPETVWTQTPPAEALARLAELYGRRVVYQPLRDRVLVVPPGVGGPLPAGPLEALAPAVDSPEAPAAVAVAGAPVRVQMRLLLEPVGKEWDGSYRPVNELSYAPQAVGGKVQVSTVTFSGPAAAPSVKVFLDFNAGWNLPAPPGGGETSLSFQYGEVSSAATKLARVADAVNAHPVAGGLIAASAVGNALSLTGRSAGFPFSVRAETSAPAPNALTAALVQAPVRPGGYWGACPPPRFADVRPTARLSYDQAVALAQQSVFKCYRVLYADPNTGAAPIRVPWVGSIRRRHQLILQPTKVDQVEPEPRDPAIVRKAPNVAIAIRAMHGGLPEFYDGYSRDRAAEVYGSVAVKVTNAVWPLLPGGDLNTPDGAKVPADFTVDSQRQLVVFSDYVYRWLSGAEDGMTVEFPRLVLETACLVTHETTGELLRWKRYLRVGGSAPIEWQVRDDVQACVRGVYGPGDTLLRHEFVDEQEANDRAAYYLRGMAVRHQLSAGESRTYIGTVPIDPDGYIQQVSWAVGPSGATTQASGNSEHSASVPPYPARRRAENLPPNKAAAAANLIENQLTGVTRVLPPVLGRGFF